MCGEDGEAFLFFFVYCMLPVLLFFAHVDSCFIESFFYLHLNSWRAFGIARSHISRRITVNCVVSIG
jgi:hypothetical protein